MLVNIIAKRNIPFILLLLFSFLLISCDLFEKTDDNAEKDDKQDEFCRLNLRGYVDINSPEFLTISPDNKHVYVCASGGTPGVYWFKRDIETGWLYGDIFTDYFSVGWTNVIAISPDGRQVYANDTMTFSIICLQRDLDTGVLDNPKDKSVPGVSFFTLTRDGKHLYSTDGMNIYWLTRDLYTGELYGDPTNDFINIPSGVNDIIVSPDGKHLYSTGGMNVYWLTRDFETGRLDCDQMSDYINIPDVNLIGISISPDGKHIYSNDNTLQEIGSLS
ncbi:MAG: hypothetical protein KAT05_06175, partial [Spirochaetes bacterium]|nr:hypothetical protein [Spirochaetota bacterium]